MLNLAVLISGRGSNMEALINAAKQPGFPARVVTVISNNPDAKGLEIAEAAGIHTHVVDHRKFRDREDFERALDTQIAGQGVQLICLAGFMRILTPWFVARWRDRLINIHPSLLPAFPGLDTHKAALEAGVKVSGCTIHFVRSEMDAGPIILQASVPVLPGDTEETLAARVLEAEHKAYPEGVRLIAKGRVNVIDEKVFVTGAK